MIEDTDELPFHYTPPDERPLEPDDRAPRKCAHPKYRRLVADGVTTCGSCSHVFSADGQARGRRNRNRGNSIERQVGKRLGLTRVGQYGTATDLGSIAEPFAVQVKSGGTFPERLYRLLRTVPAVAGQTPLLVLTDAPGPGIRRRALVVLELDEWISLHGPTAVPE